MVSLNESSTRTLSFILVILLTSDSSKAFIILCFSLQLMRLTRRRTIRKNFFIFFCFFVLGGDDSDLLLEVNLFPVKSIFRELSGEQVNEMRICDENSDFSVFV